MLDNGKVTVRQLVLLMITARVAQKLVILHPVAMGLKQDAWLSEIVSLVVQLGIFFVFYQLYQRFPQYSMLGYCQIILGPTIGKVCGLAILFYLLLIVTFLNREMAGVLMLSVMPETPRVVLMVIMSVATGYIVSSGLEVLARVNELVVGFLIAAYFMVIFLLAGTMDFGNLLPMMEFGFAPILNGGIASASGFMFSVALAMVLPRVKLGKWGWLQIVWGQLIYGLMFIVGTIAVICVLGPGLGETYVQPGYILTKLINVADVVVIVESLAVALWVAGTYIKIAIFYYVFITGLAEWLSLKDYHALVVPTGILTVALGNILFEDYLQYRHFYVSTWTRFNLLFEVALPTLLLLVAIFRQKGRRNSAEPDQMAPLSGASVARQ